MRILVVTECFYPDIYAVNSIVRVMVERGHKVTVLTGLPDYTTSYIPEEYKHGKNRHQEYYGADVYRVPTIARRHGPIWRSLSFLSFVVSGKLFARFHKWDEFDVIYVWEVSPVTMAEPAITLKKRYQKPLFLYCLDIWPECVKAMNIQEGTLPFRMIHAWSRRIYRQCDHIAVGSEPFFSYLEKTDGVVRAKMSYLPQYAPGELLEEDFTKETEIGEGHHTDFLYIGNIGKVQNLDCLIRAAARFKSRDDVTFHLVGGGSEYENLLALTKKIGAERIVKFYGPRPPAEAKEFYRLADACVLTLDGSNKIGDTLPGKLQTYMAAGKPVLGALNGAGRAVIKESKAGGAVAAGDDAGLAELLSDFIAHPTRYYGCGAAARTYFKEHFLEERHFQDLEGRLEELCLSYE